MSVTGGLPAVRFSTNTARPFRSLMVKVPDCASTKVGSNTVSRLLAGFGKALIFKLSEVAKPLPEVAREPFRSTLWPPFSTSKRKLNPPLSEALLKLRKATVSVFRPFFENCVQVVRTHEVVHITARIAVGESVRVPVEKDVVRRQQVVLRSHRVFPQQFHPVHVDFHLVVEGGAEARVQPLVLRQAEGLAEIADVVTALDDVGALHPLDGGKTVRLACIHGQNKGAVRWQGGAIPIATEAGRIHHGTPPPRGVAHAAVLHGARRRGGVRAFHVHPEAKAAAVAGLAQVAHHHHYFVGVLFIDTAQILAGHKIERLVAHIGIVGRAVGVELRVQRRVFVSALAEAVVGHHALAVDIDLRLIVHREAEARRHVVIVLQYELAAVVADVVARPQHLGGIQWVDGGEAVGLALLHQARCSWKTAAGYRSPRSNCH